jgi:hypothetical protein
LFIFKEPYESTFTMPRTFYCWRDYTPDTTQLNAVQGLLMPCLGFSVQISENDDFPGPADMVVHTRFPLSTSKQSHLNVIGALFLYKLCLRTLARVIAA